MNSIQSGEILTSMINFIKSHGDDRVKDINDEAEEQFNVNLEKMIEVEKTRLGAQLEQDL